MENICYIDFPELHDEDKLLAKMISLQELEDMPIEQINPR